MNLIIGVGNPTRRDDGAGPEVVRRLEARSLSGVELRSTTQLDPSLAVDLANYEKVIVVDADPAAEEVKLEPAPEEAGLASTHHFTPSALRELTKSIHGKSPEVWVCRVPARDFEFGEAFSVATLDGLEKATEALVTLVQ